MSAAGPAPGRKCSAASRRRRLAPDANRQLAKHQAERQNGAVPTIQVKDVPDDTHRVLKLRAAAAHQSLQEYLLSRLIDDAAQPTLEEVLDRIEHRTDGNAPLAATSQLVRDDRDRR